MSTHFSSAILSSTRSALTQSFRTILRTQFEMKDQVSNSSSVTPMFFPFEPEHFWRAIRQIIREELKNAENQKSVSPTNQTLDRANKPLCKIAEVCAIFQVTKPTIYDWVKRGKLKPFKIRSRVYFLRQDIQQLLPSHKQEEHT